MINFNGNVCNNDEFSALSNRGFLFGDAVFETMKIVDNRIVFLEDHYFRLMASMRILRMEIPMNFTMEYFEEMILNLVATNNVKESARARITIFRNDGGFYQPITNEISFVINCAKLPNKHYLKLSDRYEVELYKDFYVAKNLLSTLKTTNKILYVTASIFAKENDLDNCIIINDIKNVVEATNGNLFMLCDNKLITPPLTDGCLNGVLRKQVIKIVKKMTDYELQETPISPFDLQKANELFITNVISGVQPITKYRKKEFSTKFAFSIVDQLNDLISIS